MVKWEKVGFAVLGTAIGAVLGNSLYQKLRAKRSLVDEFMGSDLNWQTWAYHDAEPRGPYTVQNGLATFHSGPRNINVYTKQSFRQPGGFRVRGRFTRDIYSVEDEFYAFMCTLDPARWHRYEYGIVTKFHDPKATLVTYCGNFKDVKDIDWRWINIGVDLGKDFHVYDVRCFEGRIEFIVDGQLVSTLNMGDIPPPGEPMSLIIGFTNYSGTDCTGNIGVYDYVEVYEGV